MSRIKLIHIIGQLGYGGAERLVLDIARKLDKNVFDVKVVALKGMGAMEEQFAAAGIPVTVIAKRFRGDLGVIRRVESYLKQEQPNLVHTHLFLGDYFGGTAALNLGIPVVSTKHDVMNIGRARQFLMSRVHRKFNHVVAISEATKEFVLRKERVPVEKVSLIYNGIDPAKYYNENAKIFTTDTVTFGSVGRLVPEKGHKYLLRAARFITNKNWNMIIVGDGPERKNLELLMHQLHLQDHISFVGAHDDVRPYLEKMDVFVLPSITEGLGLAVIEAAMAGKFVIASNVGGIPEIVTDGQDGLLFRPKRMEQLVRHFQWVFDHKADAAVMAKKLQASALSRFSINDIMLQYEALYHSVVD